MFFMTALKNVLYLHGKPTKANFLLQVYVTLHQYVAVAPVIIVRVPYKKNIKYIYLCIDCVVLRHLDDGHRRDCDMPVKNKVLQHIYL